MHPTDPPNARSRLSYLPSCFSILLNSLTAGAIFCFPLIGPGLQRDFSLATRELNSIAVGGTLGQYATAVIFGKLCDKRGPQIVSFLASILFFCGYFIFSAAIQPESWIFGSPHIYAHLTALYFVCGMGTAASYFSAVSCSSKTFPNHPGLAISLPTSFFGLSSLFLSTIASNFFIVPSSSGSGGEINTPSFLRFLAFFLAAVNIIGALGLRVYTAADHFPTEPNDDQAEPSERTPLVRTRTMASATPPRYPPAFGQSRPLSVLLWDGGLWALMLVVFVTGGSGEMVIACLGSIASSLLHSTITGLPAALSASADPALSISSRQVQLLALSNTSARLLFGFLSDFLAVKPASTADDNDDSDDDESPKARFRVSRLTFLLIATLLSTVAFAWASFKLSSVHSLWIVSVGTGLGYGGLFSLAPAVCAQVWSVEDFGRNFGILAWAAAAGATVFTILYGVVADAVASQQPSIPEGPRLCSGKVCFTPTMLACFILNAMACVVVCWLWRRWRGKL